MKLIARSAIISTRAMFRSNMTVWAKSKCMFRVLPTDLDLNFHLNNGRYLQIMDAGRFDWLIRTGVLQSAVMQRQRVVVCGAMLKFIRELKAFEKFSVTCQLKGWDKGYFYFEHRLERCDGELAALAVVRGVLLQRGTPVSPGNIASHHGYPRSLKLPAYIQAWKDADSMMRRFSRESVEGLPDDEIDDLLVDHYMNSDERTYSSMAA